jgi:hypothetical protein
MTATPEPSSYASWPPPGLEPVHGKLEPVITLLAVADLLLVVPLLAGVGTTGPFWSTGPFGGIWWMLLVTTFLGSMLFVASATELIRFFRTAAAGAERGHGWRTILLVASDDSRDTGFVLQGGRAYAGVARARRDGILRARLVATGGLILAGGLMPVGFAAGLVAARLNWAGPGFLWFASLWLPLAVLVIALAARAVDRVLSGSIRRDQARRQAADQEVTSEIADWNRRLRESSAHLRVATGSPVGRAFNAGALAVGVLALAVILPVTLLTVAGTIGSMMAEIGLPTTSNTRGRIAAVRLLRRYRLETDPRITADSAGAALHALTSVGPAGGMELPFTRAPSRVYADPWWPAGERQGPLGLNVGAVDTPPARRTGRTTRAWPLIRHTASLRSWRARPTRTWWAHAGSCRSRTP